MSQTPETTQPGGRRFGWEQFRFVVAALLLAAAVSKIVNMAQILTGSCLLNSMPRLVAVTAFEAAAVAYLMVGNRFLSWLLTLGTFAVFVASAVYAMATDRSCGCFGKQLAPETMVIVDSVVLLLTGCLRPGSRGMSSRNLIRQLTLVALMGGLAAGATAWRYEVLIKHERSRMLLADVLVGKPWPLNEQMDPRLSELGSGQWMVLIAHRDCGHCRNMVARYFADPQTHRPGERTAFFAFGYDDDQWRFEFDRVTFELPDDALLSWPHGKPYVVNPAVFLLEDGIVVDAAEGEESVQFMESLMSALQPSTP